ncbi:MULTISPECIES: site-specific integrase [Hyphomicrobiales]|jgi:integrase|uniref:site-specific integrase n=1 Tax=Methylobacterium sp. CCH7-A2 TaxID=1768789 RepID=UPI000831ACB3|nr:MULTISPECIES: site-specific integrase [Hyphomicrobiales]
MGTITPRKRANGSIGYTAQIVRKRGKEFLHREAKTFDREREAKAWLRFREAELDKPGALDDLKKPIIRLADAIDKYTATSTKEIGRTKTQVLRSIKQYDIAEMDCATIKSEHIVSFAQELLDGGRHPSTVGNYISHLAAIFAIARPAWGYRLDQQAIKDAQAALARLGTVAKSRQRTRRPTLAELDRLLQHFVEVQTRRPKSNPMARVIAFAIFSTRRMEEITRLTWADLDEVNSRILVRDMKHPGQKAGNDTWVELPPEALAIVRSMPKVKPQIFPYSTDAIGMAFTRACDLLAIEDLRFHDLRHEGVSRLFEMGRTIPLAASVSGHRSWQSLQRYSQIRDRGDKFANWPWLAKLTAPRTTG